MFLLCCYDVMFTLETKNIQHEVFFGLRDLSVMSLCRKCEPGLKKLRHEAHLRFIRAL